MKIGVIGAGRLGICFALLCEQAGDDVSLVVGNTERYRQAGATTVFNGIRDSTTSSAANMVIGTNLVISLSTSSLRYKKDVEDYDLADAYTLISGLRPITYRAKDEPDLPEGIEPSIGHDSKRLGFIAEEIDEVEEMLVDYIELDGEIVPDYVQYERITAPLVKVIQDLMTRIDSLEAQLNG